MYNKVASPFDYLWQTLELVPGQRGEVIWAYTEQKTITIRGIIRFIPPGEEYHTVANIPSDMWDKFHIQEEAIYSVTAASNDGSVTADVTYVALHDSKLILHVDSTQVLGWAMIDITVPLK